MIIKKIFEKIYSALEDIYIQYKVKRECNRIDKDLTCEDVIEKGLSTKIKNIVDEMLKAQASLDLLCTTEEQVDHEIQYIDRRPPTSHEQVIVFKLLHHIHTLSDQLSEYTEKLEQLLNRRIENIKDAQKKTEEELKQIQKAIAKRKRSNR